MTAKLSVLCLSTALFFNSSLGFAQSLRDDSMDVFQDPSIGSWEQVVLGLTELGVASVVWPKMEREERAVRDAERRLATAQELPTSKADLQAQVYKVLGNEENYEEGRITLEETDLTDHARKKITAIQNSPILSTMEKAKRVSGAQQDVLDATENALKAAQERGFIHKSVRIVRTGTAIVFLVDLAARAYIWNVLEADPTFSPIGNLTAQGLKNVLK